MNRSLTAGAAAALLLLAACGPATIDTAVIEKDIRSTIAEDKVDVETVDCPKDPEAKAGTSYVCSYVVDGSSGEVTVSVRDDEGAGRWDVTTFASGHVAQDIRAGYEKEGQKVATVDCPDPLKDGTSTCTVRLKDGAESKVTVTIEGNEFSWESQ